MFIVITILVGLSGVDAFSPVTGVAIAGLSSVGAYRLLLRILVFLIQKSPRIRRWMLGAEHLEGVWAGYNIQPDGDTFLVVERFEQSIDDLVIRGDSYSLDGRHVTNWEAEIYNTDSEKGTLAYNFNCRTLAKGKTFKGTAHFNFQRPKKEAPTSCIQGFVYDITADRQEGSNAYEEKIADTVEAESMSDQQAVSRAREIYEQRVNGSGNETT
jgi:hypothetical protein